MNVDEVIDFCLQTFPFFGIVPALMTEEGKEITEPGVKGYLVCMILS